MDQTSCALLASELAPGSGTIVISAVYNPLESSTNFFFGLVDLGWISWNLLEASSWKLPAESWRCKSNREKYDNTSVLLTLDAEFDSDSRGVLHFNPMLVSRAISLWIH